MAGFVILLLLMVRTNTFGTAPAPLGDRSATLTQHSVPEAYGAHRVRERKPGRKQSTGADGHVMGKSHRQAAPARCGHSLPGRSAVRAGKATTVPSGRPLAAVRRASKKFLAVATLGAAVVVGVPSLLPGSTAVADPSADQWLAVRKCESSNNYAINTGNGYYGAYQFDLATWRSVGGSGYPHQATPAEQDARALMLYRMRGWQPWECARILGLVNDKDAKSKHTGDISISGASSNQSSSSSDNPGYQGQLSFGASSNAVKVWQQQMAARGANIPATGYFGPSTKALVLEVQRQNGLEQLGYIGPKTWAAAWNGTYNGSSASAPAAAPQPSASSSAPSYPGQLRKGVYSEALRKWQLQMAAKGAALEGTGYFGPKTAAVVLAVQRQNGLEQVGYIGPKTWAAAWNGSYTA